MGLALRTPRYDHAAPITSGPSPRPHGGKLRNRAAGLGSVGERAAGVDPKKIEGETHDGVVEVTIPLPKEAKKETIAITPTAA